MRQKLLKCEITITAVHLPVSWQIIHHLFGKSFAFCVHYLANGNSGHKLCDAEQLLPCFRCVSFQAVSRYACIASRAEAFHFIANRYGIGIPCHLPALSIDDILLEFIEVETWDSYFIVTFIISEESRVGKGYGS